MRDLAEVAFSLREKFYGLDGQRDIIGDERGPDCEAYRDVVRAMDLVKSSFLLLEGLLEKEERAVPPQQAAAEIERVESTLRDAIAHSIVHGRELVHHNYSEPRYDHGRWTWGRPYRWRSAIEIPGVDVLEAYAIFAQPEVVDVDLATTIIAASRKLGISPYAFEAILDPPPHRPIGSPLDPLLAQWGALGERLDRDFLRPHYDQDLTNRTRTKFNAEDHRRQLAIFVEAALRETVRRFDSRAGDARALLEAAYSLDKMPAAHDRRALAQWLADEIETHVGAVQTISSDCGYAAWHENLWRRSFVITLVKTLFPPKDGEGCDWRAEVERLRAIGETRRLISV